MDHDGRAEARLRRRFLTYDFDVTKADAIVTDGGVDLSLRVVVEMLGEGEPHDVFVALAVIRDAALTHGNARQPLRTEIPEALMPALGELLLAPVFALRKHAINAIGKLTFPEEARRLEAVFDSYVEHDPLLLPSLLGELSWLGSERTAAFLERAQTHRSPITRWAALSVHRGLNERERGWLNVNELANDPFLPAKAEAAYLLASGELETAAQAAHWAPKKEWRTKRKDLERRAPLRFDMASLQFVNRLPDKGDYTVGEFAAFVDEMLRQRS